MITSLVETQVRTLIAEPNYGKFEIEPLERGYGVTLGNALRRVLLSSIPGAAITSVRIEGVLSEFEPIPGVKEDTIHFLLNLKNVALRVDMNYPRDRYSLRLQAQGPGRVTAADIQAPMDVEIMNPELYLATLSEGARLNVDITVEIGRGYLATLKRERERGRTPIGEIRVNALFNPVTKVNFLVEPTLVGDRTDFDRLILEIWTNGAATPSEALSQAATILTKQFQLITALGSEHHSDQAAVVSPPPGVTVPDRPLEELGLSTRVLNALRSGGIDTLYKLLSTPEQKLITLRNFGDTARKEVEDKLSAMGLSLMKSGRRRSL